MMLKFARCYVNIVDKTSYRIGRMTMYLIFVMAAVLLYSVASKAIFFTTKEWLPFGSIYIDASWTMEMAQFIMVAYYLLGGGYSMQMGGHVRMDLFYGSLKPRKKTWFDAITVLFLIFYLGVLLYGGISSTLYALEYGERSYSAWRPYMAPIKIIMCIGILLTMLQAISYFFKDVAKLCGVELGGLELEEQV